MLEREFAARGGERETTRLARTRSRWDTLGEVVRIGIQGIEALGRVGCATVKAIRDDEAPDRSARKQTLEADRASGAVLAPPARVGLRLLTDAELAEAVRMTD